MKKGILFLLLLLVGVGSSYAQGRKGLVINEVMVSNQNNVVDDYGIHNAWIELYNSTYASMEISTIYLTTDSTNRKMYAVPRGDVNTKIPPRQHTLFWADGEPERGTFHVSFKLNPGQNNWIGLYDSNGITLIDSITIPATLGIDQSFARKADGEGVDLSAWGVRHGTKANMDYVSPSSNNIIRDVNVKKQSFAQKDPNGVAMAIIAMGIVFCALLLLSIAFSLIGKVSKRSAAKKKVIAQNEEPTEQAIANAVLKGTDSGEEIAAVCMALYEHLNAHDNEDTVLTINKVKRAYSPWSSKIYTLRELPHR